MTAARLLIVNADDLGLSAAVNVGVFAAHRRGLVTSATLMVTRPAAAAAAAGLAEHPKLGAGLHVALSGGRTALPATEVPSLVDASGGLPDRPERLEAPAPDELLAEVRAQVARFRELTGRLPTHLDGHHHCHRLPGIAAAVVRVAGEAGLPVRAVSAEHRAVLAAAGLRAPDRFVERFYGAGATLDALREILAGLAPGVTELMTHPGEIDALLRATSSYVDERRRELEILTDRAALRAVRESSIRPIHYGDLAALAEGGE